MRVCFFGTYERDYPRNQILLKAMELAGIEVLECHSGIWKHRIHKTGEIKNKFSLFALIIKLAVHYPFLLLRYLLMPDHDLVLAGYPGHLDVIMLKPFAMLRRKKIVFDAFISLYDAVVSDRKLQDKDSWISRFLFQLDKRSCLLTDRVILDTHQHIQYFSDTFSIPRNHFSRLFASADDRLFKPAGVKRDFKSETLYKVVFCGKFTPFHGIEIILAAAVILEDDPNIKFELIGDGQLFEKLAADAKKKNLRNVHFAGWVPYLEFSNHFCRADVCLGVFGNTEKSNRVIPNKIFQALATRKPVITARAQAVEELLTDMESVYFVTPGDAEELAHAIITLKNDAELADKIAANGYRVFSENANLDCVSRDLSTIFKLV